MLSIDAILNGFAVLSAIVATLRAGSRAIYISEHHSIGVMDGPLILPPSLQTTTTISASSPSSAVKITTTCVTSTHHALYELSETFRHCVRLAVLPSLYENVEHQVSVRGPPPRDAGGIRRLAVLLRPNSNDDDAAAVGAASARRRRRRQDQAFHYSLGGTPYVPRSFRTRRENRPGPTSEEDDADVMDDDVDGEKILEQLLTEELRSAGSKTTQRGDEASGTVTSEDGRPASGPRRWWRLLSKRERPVMAVEETSEGGRTDHDAPPGRWDYGWATEGDYFYNVSSTVATKSGGKAGLLVDDEDDISSPDETDETTASTTTITRQRLAELTVYCPETFADLRCNVFGIPQGEYLRSILASGPFVSFQSNSKGAARVGGVFFFTRDGAYMIKTIKPEEANTLLKMLPKYHRHMKRYARSSLLTRFCGLYGVNIEEEDEADVVSDGVDDATRAISSARESIPSLAPTGKKQIFVVMNAVFPAEAAKFLSERFDLKGSTVGREVSDEELQTKGSNAVLKDMDLANEVKLVKSMGMSKFGLTIGAVAKAALLAQLREDAKFLVDCQVMDYSLLVGVVHMDVHKNHQSIRKAMESIKKQDRILQQLEYKSNRKLDSTAIYMLTTPARLILSPPLYLARRAWSLARRVVDSIITIPMPYYGSGACGIDGGKFSVFHGQRRGDRALYYMGLIDFLQPWTTRKVLERKIKALMGYDTNAISSVTPEEYASRFLDYLDANIT